MSDKTSTPQPATPPTAPTWQIIGADGTPGGDPTPEDRQLLERAQALLRADADFQKLTGATLTRVEVNRGMHPTDSGYLYLRYEVTGGTPQEFWPRWGKADRVAWKSGQISVKPA
jgi:hypothetical protein